MPESLFSITWQAFKKETLAQMFYCEFCEISKNTFFYRTPPVALSEDNTIQSSISVYFVTA